MKTLEILRLCGDLSPRELDIARSVVHHYETKIAAVLDQNRYLADGEQCTLSELKKLAPNWN